jgi:integrase/recombinase XerD
MSLVAPTLEAFFTKRLVTQKDASPHTIASYRDCLKLLLAYVQETTGIAPSKLDFSDLDATVIGGFLHHLERDRGLSARSRNIRLAAIRSLFSFAALRHPEHAAVIGRVLAIPAKRGERTLVSFLVPAEVDALLASPDRSRRLGRRDHALLVLAQQRPGCASASSARSASRTSTSAPAPSCTAPARAERNVRPRSPS